MKCEIVIQNIDQYFYEGLAELNAEARQHLASCHDCNTHFAKQKSAGDVVKRIADFEPVINDPAGLTDDIMMGLSDTERTPKSVKIFNPLSAFKSVNFRRALSAAAILLFAVFSVEQYTVLDKINRLEINAKKISANKASAKKLRMYNAWEFQLLRNFNQAKSTNRMLIKKLTDLGNNVTLSNEIPAFPGKYAFSPEELFRELYDQKEFSPLMRKYLSTIK